MKLAYSLIALLACVTPALAQNTPFEGDRLQVAESRTNISREKLSLSDDQKSKLGALRDQFQLSTAQTKAQLMVSQRQLRQALTASTVDKQAALSLQSKINALRNSLSDERLKLKLAAGDIFTTEQREAMKQFRHHRRGGRGHSCQGFGKGFSGGRQFGPGRGFGPSRGHGPAGRIGMMPMQDADQEIAIEPSGLIETELLAAAEESPDFDLGAMPADVDDPQL